MNLLSFPRLWLPVYAVLFMANTVAAQSVQTPRQTALRFLQENPAAFGLSAADVSDIRVTDEYLTKHNGITHVWVQQQYAGIPVFNGLFGLHVKPDGKVAYLAHRFVPDIAARANTTLPSLSASKALEMAMANLGFSGFPVPSVRQKVNERNWIFEGGAVSKTDIPVSICYSVQKDGSVRLAWTMVIAQADASDVWNMRVDAQNGLVIDKINQTLHCSTGDPGVAEDGCEEVSQAPVQTSGARPQTTNVLADETYNVFALPVESPIHGPRQIVVNPADPLASPFGWHDTNGAPGPEYTYTRGNNVYAFDDRNDDDLPPTTPFPNAGASLNFNYPYDINNEPLDNLDAAITNLFYVNNMMHDITYRLGFDEPAGNFQQNNYGNGGVSGDPVRANAIDGYALASQKQNNADFSTPQDGFSPQMQMFVWTRSGGQLLTVNGPAPVLGTYVASATNGWGAAVSATPVTGDVEIADDGSGNSTWACNPLQNDMTGKIALIDRQDCTFVDKALNAQNAGAKGCIICNYENETVLMGAGVNSPSGQVEIPVIMLRKSDCDILRQYAGAGLNVSIVQPANPGPNLYDGDFDNGIIAHEHGHGISNRLTGGPSQAGCLGNIEQMGEGWSDFFSLITMVKPGDTGAKRRGLGNYVLRQTVDGTGIRRNAYSTDMSINPVTFSWVAETPQNDQIHARGEIWASALWDLYWAMVEKYGYDADLANTSSGNFRAAQLVIDGLKMQPCEPGNIDGRNAIFLADILNYNGEDTCLISAVFARRGMGYLASQGSPDDAADGVENFDPIPTCIRELKIKKETSTPLIEPGENIQITITVTNHKSETANNVIVTDELPAGLILTSASGGGTLSNGMVTWNLGDMTSGQVIQLSYTAKSADAVGSNRYFRDVMDTNDDWYSLNANQNGQEYFSLQNNVVKTGTHAWEAASVPNQSRFSLETLQEITVAGAKPVLRFWHQYNTEKSLDAGIFEVKPTADLTWQSFPANKIFRNPYPGKLDYGTFAVANLSGFSGNSNGWVQSYLDLSDYSGETVNIRFRFGTNEDSGTQPVGHWYIDEIEVMDMLNYDTEACVADDNGDHACAKAKERGVIVQPGIVGADEPRAGSIPMQVQPNPAYDMLYISAGVALAGPVRVELIGTDGRVVLSRQMNGVAEGQVLTLDVQQVPAGIYVVRLESAAGSSVRKVVIR